MITPPFPSDLFFSLLPSVGGCERVEEEGQRKGERITPKVAKSQVIGNHFPWQDSVPWWELVASIFCNCPLCHLHQTASFPFNGFAMYPLMWRGYTHSSPGLPVVAGHRGRFFLEG